VHKGRVKEQNAFFCLQGGAGRDEEQCWSLRQKSLDGAAKGEKGGVIWCRKKRSKNKIGEAERRVMKNHAEAKEKALNGR